MKKVISYVVVFVLGFAACAAVFYYFFGSPINYQGPEVAKDMPRGGVGVVSSDIARNPIREAAKKVTEYVVNIDTIGKPVIEPGFGFDMPFSFGFPFEKPQEIIPKGQASGVIFTSDGYILTNNHVVEDAAKLTVTLHNGRSYQAKIIGRDPKTDLAVIKVDAKGLPYAKFAKSSTLQAGDWVIAVGSPLGRAWSVTVGIVSDPKRGPINIDGKVLEQVIQTDAAINRGNSGGALADINGNLVGINFAIESTAPGGGSIGIGFAIPSDLARKIADELVKHGKVIRPWMGIVYAPYNQELREALKARGVRNLPNEDGAIIREVISGSPAAEAGLQPLDIILKINGKPVSGKPEPGKGEVTVAGEVEKAKVGSRITLEVWHASNNTRGIVGVRVGTMPANMNQ